MMTPTSGLSRLRAFKTSSPPLSGRLTSTRARSNTCSPNFFKPASAVAAATVWWPSKASNCSRLSRISFSSSMIRIEPLRDMDGFPYGWKFEAEGGPPPHGAFDCDLPAVFADDPVADGKAKARAAARGLGGEEGVKNFREIFGRNTHAIVSHLNSNG